MCGVNKLYSLRKHPQQGGMVHLPCGCWTCQECSKWKSKQWVGNFQTRTEFLKAVYRTTIDAAEWKAVYMRLSRSQARYFVVQINSCRLAVYSDVALTGAESLLPATALQRFQLDLGNAARQGRVVRSSRAWKLPRRSPRITVFREVVRKAVIDQVLCRMKANRREFSGDVVWGFTVDRDIEVVSIGCKLEAMRRYGRVPDACKSLSSALTGTPTRPTPTESPASQAPTAFSLSG